MVLVRLIQQVDSELVANGSTQKLVIVGPSMGGQIARYALAYMEKQQSLGVANMNHNARLFISFDSPHRGANIPISIQQTLFHLGYFGNKDDAKASYESQLRSKAGRQLLIEQMDGLNRTATYFTTYYNNLYSGGLPNSQGWPMNLRKVALINGNAAGILTNTASQKIMHLDANAVYPVRGIKLDLFNMPNYGNSIATYDGFIRGLGFGLFPNNYNANIPLVYNMNGTNTHTYVPSFLASFGFKKDHGIITTYNNNSNGSMDVVPGGTFNTIETVKEQITKTLNEWYIAQKSINWSDLQLNHCFVPTISSLAFKNTNFNWATPVNNRNLVCTNEIPFDNYYTPPSSEHHITLTDASVKWILEEIQYGLPNCPTICASTINGIGTGLCLNQVKTVSLNVPLPPNCGILWEVSNGITALSSTTSNSSLDIKSTGSNSNGWVKATITPKDANGNKCGGATVVLKQGFPSGNGGTLSFSLLSPGDNCFSKATFSPNMPGNSYAWSKDGTNYTSTGSDPTSASAFNIVNLQSRNNDISNLYIYCRLINSCGTVYYNRKYIPITNSQNPPCTNVTVAGRLTKEGASTLKADVYPNPTSDYWTVQIPIYLENAFTFILYDINGRVVYLKENVSLENSNYYLDGSKLSKGVYLLKIKDKNKQEHQYKLVKN